MTMDTISGLLGLVCWTGPSTGTRCQWVTVGGLLSHWLVLQWAHPQAANSQWVTVSGRSGGCQVESEVREKSWPFLYGPATHPPSGQWVSWGGPGNRLPGLELSCRLRALTRLAQALREAMNLSPSCLCDEWQRPSAWVKFWDLPLPYGQPEGRGPVGSWVPGSSRDQSQDLVLRSHH